MELADLRRLATRFEQTGRMPVLFLGHGSPMNAIEDNQFSHSWRALRPALPKPRAILCVSAHWETRGTQVTAMQQPRTIHDFGGFPRELYEVQYPAPGSVGLAEEISQMLVLGEAALDGRWGLDHGCWSVVMPMFPAADIPVLQLSLDVDKTGQAHYETAKALAALRKEGVLIVASGNMVHNLRLLVLSVTWPDGINTPFGLDWAIEANDLFKKLIDARNHRALAEYQRLGRAAQLAINSAEHYLPMLYALALQERDEDVWYFNDVPVAGSLTMTSFAVS